MDPRATDKAARDAEALVAVIDAQRAEQRNAESLLSRLGEARDALRAHGSEEGQGPARLDALDREIATVAARVKQALKLQGELMMRLGGGEPGRGASAG
jgi:hypothetical protein